MAPTPATAVMRCGWRGTSVCVCMRVCVCVCVYACTCVCVPLLLTSVCFVLRVFCSLDCLQDVVLYHLTPTFLCISLSLSQPLSRPPPVSLSFLPMPFSCFPPHFQSCATPALGIPLCASTPACEPWAAAPVFFHAQPSLVCIALVRETKGQHACVCVCVCVFSSLLFLFLVFRLRTLHVCHEHEHPTRLARPFFPLLWCAIAAPP